VAKKAVIKKKKINEEKQTEIPSVVFLDGSEKKNLNLTTLGLIVVVLGFLSTTPLMAKTIFYQSADFMVGIGLVGIVAGIIINNRKRISDLFNSNKKN
jgi:hypothetical protein